MFYYTFKFESGTILPKQKFTYKGSNLVLVESVDRDRVFLH